jgi:hypothetical protein
MNPLLETVAEIDRFLTERNIPYVIMGGLAAQYWGEPRTTSDVDIQILIEEGAQERLFNELLQHFHERVSSALELALRIRVLLLQGSNGTPIDLTLAVPGYGEQVMMRRHLAQLHPDYSLFALISPEDLIIHKCLAGRPIDAQDIKAVLKKQANKLDLSYIRERLAEFAPLVEEFDVQAFLDDAMRER